MNSVPPAADGLPRQRMRMPKPHSRIDQPRTTSARLLREPAGMQSHGTANASTNTSEPSALACLSKAIG